jgi:branched-chain amino acid transport system ATP-binding protein
MLAGEDLSKRFGGLSVLAEISFRVRAGTVFALIGPNGAGKTTLFNILTGFVRPDAGRVVFDGRDITSLSPERRAGLGIARTFQVVKPFSLKAAVGAEFSFRLRAASIPGCVSLVSDAEERARDGL